LAWLQAQPTDRGRVKPLRRVSSLEPQRCGPSRCWPGSWPAG